MAQQVFFIGPYTKGVQKRNKPWLLPDDAFEELRNAYVARNVVKKRPGCTLIPSSDYTGELAHLGSRLRLAVPNSEVRLGGGVGVGITDASGDAGGAVPGANYRIGQKFSIGTEVFTVVELGAPGVMTTTGASTTHTFNTSNGHYAFVGAEPNAQIYFYPEGGGMGTTDGNGDAVGLVPGSIFRAGQIFTVGNVIFTVVIESDGQGPQELLVSLGDATGIFDTDTGSFSLEGADANEQIYFYPSTPVMGIITHEQVQISDENTYVFDTQYAYQRVGDAWDRLGSATWTGDDSQFFWTENYRGLLSDDYYLYVVNHHQPDQIKYFDGLDWNTLVPATRNVPGHPYTLQTARIIVSFKNRLVCLNTVEEVGTAGQYHTFAQRARWSMVGNPIPTVGDPGAWYDNVSGRGGWIDASTKEAIISAKVLRDRLIVFFERSTWELVYTNNQVLPFVWQNIDDELGAESMMSSVLMENSVLAIGEAGLHSCDGLRVARIDSDIPDYVTDIHNDNNGVERVAGIRDFAAELIYWTCPHAERSPVYPDQVLLYNYKENTWAVFDDSITAFGYYQNAGGITWGSLDETWGECSREWGAGDLQSKYRNVLGGNQQGFTFIIDPKVSSNAGLLSITNVDLSSWPIVRIHIADHNLNVGEFIRIENCHGIDENFNGRIFKIVEVFDSGAIRVAPYSSDDEPVGEYRGGGTAARISLIDIKTKEFNFYPNAEGFYINRVDFNVDKTSTGRINVTFYSSTNIIDMATEARFNEMAVGSYVLDTFPYALRPIEENSSRLTRPVYIQAYGECIQIRLCYLDQTLIFDAEVQAEPFELNSMSIYTRTSGRSA